jgi:hypothetical protein
VRHIGGKLDLANKELERCSKGGKVYWRAAGFAAMKRQVKSGLGHRVKGNTLSPFLATSHALVCFLRDFNIFKPGNKVHVNLLSLSE